MMNDAALTEFQALLDPAGVLTEPGDLAPYETGARYGGGRAAFVLRPRTTEEVSAVMGIAARHGLHLLPQGGNTGLVGGSVPDDSAAQVVLSLDRFRQPLAIDAADRTVTVGGGVRLSTLNTALDPHGLFLPIDLGADPMIGGMIATNTGGARFLRYGDMRRHVLGVEVVLADARGTVLDFMKSLRKDNTGVDLKQLFIGSCGAFGVVTRAVVEVHRKPTRNATALMVPRDDEALLDLITATEEWAGESLVAFEGMSHAAMTHAFDHVASLRSPFPGGLLPPYAVLIELASTDAGRDLDALLEGLLEHLWTLPGAPLADAYVGRSEELWALRHALSEGMRATGPVIGFDLSFKRSDLPRFRKDMAGVLAERFPKFEICDFGHIGDGGMHFNLLARTPATAEEIDALRTFVIDETMTRFGGSFSGEHGLGRRNQANYDRYTPAAIQSLAGELTHMFTSMPFGAVRLGPKS